MLFGEMEGRSRSPLNVAETKALSETQELACTQQSGKGAVGDGQSNHEGYER